MTERTKEKQIPFSVKQTVYKRDLKRCLWCGKWVTVYNACAHYISRAQGGNGVEQNILTLCHNCHAEYDNGWKRAEMQEWFKEYLTEFYGKDFEKECVNGH